MIRPLNTLICQMPDASFSEGTRARRLVFEKRIAVQNRRSAMTLLEAAVALVILGAAMAILVQLVSLANRQRRASHERMIALAEIANQAERISLLPWVETAPDKLTTWEASPDLTAAIPQASCSAVVTDGRGPPVNRRIQLRVAWQNAAGQQVDPAVLTVWKFQTEGQP